MSSHTLAFDLVSNTTLKGGGEKGKKTKKDKNYCQEELP